MACAGHAKTSRRIYICNISGQHQFELVELITDLFSHNDLTHKVTIEKCH
jgi:hypothetical protein